MKSERGLCGGRKWTSRGQENKRGTVGMNRAHLSDKNDENSIMKSIVSYANQNIN